MAGDEARDESLVHLLLDWMAGVRATPPRDGAARPDGLGSPQDRRDVARAVQRLMGRIYFSDLACAPGGAVCAIDIDGVLEAEVSGVPMLTPAGAIGLRALHAHGCEPVVCTGRSLDQVRDRCGAYRLVAGVAEYGSAVYDHPTGQVRSLVPPRAREGFERVRSLLTGVDDVVIDPRYSHVVRAYHPPRAGRERRELEHEITAAALSAAGPWPLRAVPAGTQTDFVAASVDKGIGLEALLAGRSLAFAIGDSREDLPMLAMAARAFAPANADPLLGEAGASISPGCCQIGFAQAVAEFLGHAPGGCPRCRMGPMADELRRMLDILAGPDRTASTNSN
jgi:hypothetical protein